MVALLGSSRGASASASAPARRRLEPPGRQRPWQGACPPSAEVFQQPTGGVGLLLAVHALAAPRGAARGPRGWGAQHDAGWASAGSGENCLSAAVGVLGAHLGDAESRSGQVLLTIGFQVRELGRVRAGPGVTPAKWDAAPPSLISGLLPIFSNSRRRRSP